MFLIRQILEAAEGVIQLLFRTELNTQLLQPGTKGTAPRMLAHHHAILGPAHILGPHDLVGLTTLEHAILMDAGFMGKGVSPHHRLVWLYRKAGNVGNQP